MADLLQIGAITDVMRDQLSLEVTIHSIDNYPAGKITHIITTGADGVSAEIMNNLPNLQAVSFCSVGTTPSTSALQLPKGVVVSHTPNVLNTEVASTTVMLALMCCRNALHDNAWARTGRWESIGDAPFSRSMDNQTIGILGLGNPSLTNSPRGRRRLFTIREPRKTCPIPILIIWSKWRPFAMS